MGTEDDVRGHRAFLHCLVPTGVEKRPLSLNSTDQFNKASPEFHPLRSRGSPALSHPHPLGGWNASVSLANTILGLDRVDNILVARKKSVSNQALNSGNDIRVTRS